MSEEEGRAWNTHVWANSSYSSSSSSSSNGDAQQEERDRQAAYRKQRSRRRFKNLQTNGVFLASAIEAEENVPRGGSVVGRQTVDRDRMLIKAKIIKDYFGDPPRWSQRYFRRRYRMTTDLFLYIFHRVKEHDAYFTDRQNCTGTWGVSGMQKVLAAVRLLATGGACDDTDEYMHIGESTAAEAMIRFCTAIRQIFTNEYLRTPSAEDVLRITTENEARGFPGMLGSIDCMHWLWKNCPTSWAGKFLGTKGKPSIVLEAVATKDLWIWHANFGCPGSNNDINVLWQSNVFQPVIDGIAPPCNFKLGNNEYDMGYYLCDGIYPNWATLVKACKRPTTMAERHFTARHESVRKDVERAFGVLQARWHIVQRPARKHNIQDLYNIMLTCVILHNMIVQCERDIGVTNWRVPRGEGNWRPPRSRPEACKLANRKRIMRKETNQQLVKDLIQHVCFYDVNRENVDDEFPLDEAPTTPEGEPNEDGSYF